jgi:hypothetical protein
MEKPAMAQFQKKSTTETRRSRATTKISPLRRGDTEAARRNKINFKITPQRSQRKLGGRGGKKEQKKIE